MRTRSIFDTSSHTVSEIYSAGDTRRGLGYGQIQQRFHKPWSLEDSFPYSEEDQLEDEDEFEIDGEAYNAVNSKVLSFQMNDFGAAKSADRLYFVGAATKLSACFTRLDDILHEIVGVGRGIVPIPGLYKNFDGPAVGGHSVAPGAISGKSFRRTGTKRGWSTTPPESKVAAEIEYEEDMDPDEFYTLLGLADIQRPSLGECFLFISHT